MNKIFGSENYFYHASVRRYINLFGSLFTDLQIKRKSDDGKKEDTITVPIRYGVGNMYMKAPQTVEGRELKQVSRVLPAMAFKLDNLYKDVNRKTNSMNRIKHPTFDVDSGTKFQFNRVPYNFIFELIIRTKNSDDMMQIVEQIIPAFDGNLSVTIEDTTGVPVEQDIIISIDEVAMEDNFDDEMQSRLLEYKITFELRGFLYKRTQNSLVVKEIDLQVGYADDAMLDVFTVDDQYPITEEQNVLSKLTEVMGGMPSIDVD
jgi:hypothetical protein